MRKTKMEKGITLIALIVTIVVLLILAAVAINSITNDKVVDKTKNAVSEYEIMEEKTKLQKEILEWQVTDAGDIQTLEEYLGDIYGKNNVQLNTDESLTVTVPSGNKYIVTEDGDVTYTDRITSNGGSTDVDTTQTVTKVKNTTISTTSNTDVYDAYGNKIVVPAGFKIRVDSTTNNADTVTKGIVIEDSTGNQFVWIPVGKIYTDISRTEANAKTITLGRYENFTATDGVYTPAQTAENYATATTISSYYTEDTAANHNSSYGNAIARDIGAFVTSATTKGGYYIGRYEARTNNTTGRSAKTDALTTVTSIKTNAVYNYVTQAQASSLAQGMYVDGYSSGTFSSDLINSYAWDTAIVFLQEFDNRADKTTPYSQQTSLNTSFSSTGTTEDVICNVYDMASNCLEWSTEYYEYDFGGPCVSRGSDWSGVGDAETRWYWTKITNQWAGFRAVLYVG